MATRHHQIDQERSTLYHTASLCGVELPLYNPNPYNLKACERCATVARQRATKAVLVANPLTDATPEQAAALQRYATANGQRWKAELSLAWSTGTDEREDDSAELRQVRNQLGTAWLYGKCKIKP